MFNPIRPLLLYLGESYQTIKFFSLSIVTLVREQKSQFVYDYCQIWILRPKDFLQDRRAPSCKAVLAPH